MKRFSLFLLSFSLWINGFSQLQDPSVYSSNNVSQVNVYLELYDSTKRLVEYYEIDQFGRKVSCYKHSSIKEQLYKSESREYINLNQTIEYEFDFWGDTNSVKRTYLYNNFSTDSIYYNDKARIVVLTQFPNRKNGWVKIYYNSRLSQKYRLKSNKRIDVNYFVNCKRKTKLAFFKDSIGNIIMEKGTDVNFKTIIFDICTEFEYLSNGLWSKQMHWPGDNNPTIYYYEYIYR